MAQSMTAFVSYAQHGKYDLRWDIKSVNHKFLDIHLHMPEEVRSIEATLRNMCKQQLMRGRLECHLQLNLAENITASSIDSTLLASFSSCLHKLEEDFQDKLVVSGTDILRLPGILKPEINFAELAEVVKEAFNNAIAELLRQRQQEGGDLIKLCEQRLAKMVTEINKIKGSIDASNELMRKRLLAKVTELTAKVDNSRFEQELVYLLQKHDIAEELERLELHVAEATKVLHRRGVLGRRLDFLMQEVMREANTLGVKAIDGDISLTAIELKLLSEQIREQANNLE